VSPLEAASIVMLAEEVRELLATLSPREERILRRRFGIGEKHERTLAEVGKDFQVTRERVRQIEVQVLRRLRHSVRARRLLGLIEWG
jgi:RNA polymerase primary sigma factor